MSKAFDKGYDVGYNAENEKNPYEPGTEESDDWQEGRDAGENDFYDESCEWDNQGDDGSDEWDDEDDDNEYDDVEDEEFDNPER